MKKFQATEEAKASVIPLTDSGMAYNAFYHHCDVLESRQSYMLCQHIVKQCLRGKLKEDGFVECQQAIACGNCDAVTMMKLEKKMDRALFFIKRPHMILKSTDDMNRPMSQSGNRFGDYPPYTTPKAKVDHSIGAHRPQAEHKSEAPSAPVPKIDAGAIYASALEKENTK